MIFSILALASAINGAPPGQKLVLVCHGYNKDLAGTIRHVVEIDGDRALVDGQLFSVESSDIGFGLSGPIPAASTINVPNQYWSIDRIDGSYVVVNEDHKVTDASRTKDEGCVVTEPKF